MVCIEHAIDEGEIITAFGLTINDLIDLTGGIPCSSIRDLELRVSALTSDTIELFVKTKFYEVARVLNFADKIILNTHMYVFEQQKQIGTRLFYNQVVAARKHDFDEIQTTAMGKEDGDNWTGFYAWGRLGYQMILGDDEKFRRLMEKENRFETNLWELLSTEEGKAFWLNNGFTWMGQFILEDNSSTMLQLSSYLREKNLPFDLD